MKNAIVVVLAGMVLFAAAESQGADFGPANPFYRVSSLPFHAPAFDRIKDEDYQPAIEAGMAEELQEINKIANNPAAPTFQNTLVAMERSGRLLSRSSAVFFGVTQANINPTLQSARTALAPKLAAHSDAIRLDAVSPGIEPIVRVIDDWFTARPLGLIFECKTGNGWLLVSGIDLLTDKEKRPEARQLLYSLEKYMAGDQFAPHLPVDIKTINDLFK